MKKYFTPIIMLIIFETVAITLWLTKDNLFYLLNFSLISRKNYTHVISNVF